MSAFALLGFGIIAAAIGGAIVGIIEGLWYRFTKRRR